MVTVLFQDLRQYRVPFYRRLRSELDRRGIEFRLVHGQPPPGEREKRDTARLPWATEIENRFLRVGSRHLCWQPAVRELADSDLVVVQEASKLLLNYLLVARQKLGGARVALWGHGRAPQFQRPTRIGETLKRALGRHSHWWFAYTAGCAETVRGYGFPEERITVVENSIDTDSLRRELATVDEAEREELRARLGLRSRNVGLFVGSLYEDRRLDFLLDAARRLRGRIPDFELLVAGAGPRQEVVERAARSHDWIHYVGPRFGRDKVRLFALSRVVLFPGVLGLAAVDSFALEVPLVTMSDPGHGPEVDYLVDGRNAVVLPEGTDAEEFARAAALVLEDRSLRSRLRSGCREGARRYTLENMVDNFSEGVEGALAAGPR